MMAFQQGCEQCLMAINAGSTVFCVTQLVDVPSDMWTCVKGTTMTLDLWGTTKWNWNLAICTTRSNAMKQYPLNKAWNHITNQEHVNFQWMQYAIIQMCCFINVQRKFLNLPRNLPGAFLGTSPKPRRTCRLAETP